MKLYPEKICRPRLVLACSDSQAAVLCARQLRRQGWEVFLASSAVDARRLVHTMAPRVVVLDTDLADESGWLASAKILLDSPQLRVILVSSRKTQQEQKFSEFLGVSGLVCQSEGVEALLDEILGTAFAKTG